MRKIIFVGTALFFLSSCSLYRTFETPQVETKAIYGEGVQVNDSLVDIPSWRAMFTDPHLQSFIEKGLASNSDLQIARHHIEQAQATLLSSKLAYLPSFALAPEGGVSGHDGSYARTYNLPLTTQWELDLFGKLRNNKEQARATLLQSVEYTKMVQTQLVASIANSYYTVMMLDQQLSIARESIVNQRENLETIIELKKAGLQTETAVNQATASYYAVQVSAKDLEKQIRIVENSIALLINQPPHAVERSSFSGGETLYATLNERISLQALANRPDVKVAEYELSRNFYGVNVARAAFYPSISLSGSVGWTNNLGVISNPGTMLLSAIGTLTQPLFNKGVNRANLKIAESQYQQSLLSFQKVILVAGTEVNDALTECQNSTEKRMLRERQVEANELAMQNSRELMKHSSTTYLEVLVAQNSLLQSKLVQVSDWFEGVQGRISLYKALGGGIN